MSKKRYIWIWISQDASDIEQQCWQQFIKVNMSVSENVRFLTAESEDEYLLKQDVLEKAGWQAGRWGEGWMERVMYFTKERAE